MASRSCEMLASQNQPDREDDDRITSPSKEVRSDLNALTLDRILGTIETLTTTVARQLQNVDQRQADAFRKQEDAFRKQEEKERQRQEKTERMIAEVIAVSRES